MKKFLFALLCAVGIAASANAQMTQVAASGLKMGSTTISSGTVCAVAVDVTQSAIPVAIGGGGMQGPGLSCGVITNGVITGAVGGGAFTVPDAAQALNSGFYYNFTVTDTTRNQSFMLRLVPNVAGGSFQLDRYFPSTFVSTSGAFTFTTGSGAPSAGTCSSKSFYQDNSTSTNPVLYSCGNDNHFHIVTGTAVPAFPNTNGLVKNTSTTNTTTAQDGADYLSPATGLPLSGGTMSGAFNGPVVNGKVNPTSGVFAGADIGAKITSAMNSAFCPSQTCDMILPSGAYQMTASVTTPATLNIDFMNGAIVNLATQSVVWTMNNKFEAGRYQIISGPGSVSFATNQFLQEVFPEWFGGLPDGQAGTLDASIGWQLASNAASNVNGKGGVVSCPQAGYSFYNTVNTFSTTTANGVSYQGTTKGTVVANNSGCSIKWYGPAGGAVIHVVGGHNGTFENIVINNNTAAPASRGWWFDSANGTTAASLPIASAVESGCVTALGQASSNLCTLTVTTTGNLPASWLSGSNVSFNGTGTALDKQAANPIWYVTGANSFAISYYAVNGTIAITGNVAVNSSGDISGNQAKRLTVYSYPQALDNVASISLTGNVATATLSSPAVMYPNQWVWINSASDINYDAYWKVASVISPTQVTLTSALLASATTLTSSGQLLLPSTGISFGTNSLALANNSVCCWKAEGITVVSPETELSGISALEMDASAVGNSFDYNFDHTTIIGGRIGFLSFTHGTFVSTGLVGSHILDAVYAGLGNGTARIESDEVENGTPFIIADLLSGPGTNQAARGTANAQFESGLGTALITLTHGSYPTGGFGGDLNPDGVAISTGANLTLEHNNFQAAVISTPNPNITPGSLTGMTYTPGSNLIPGKYTVQGVGGSCYIEPVTTITVGADGQVDVTATNQAPVTVPVIGFSCNIASPPTFTFPSSGVNTGGTAPTLTPQINQVSLINVNNQNFPTTSAPKSEVVSKNNTFAEIIPGGHVPVLSVGSKQFAYGGGIVNGVAQSPLTGVSVSSEGDRTTLHAPNIGVAPLNTAGTYPLSHAFTQHEIKYMGDPNGTTQPNDAVSGFIRVPNGISFLCGAGASAVVSAWYDDCLQFNASDQLTLNGLVVTSLDANGNLFIPRTLGNTFGGIGPYQNALKDSTFQIPTGGVWTVGSGSVVPSTFTSNTTDVTDPQLNHTALKAVQTTWTGSADQGLKQVAAGLTVGQTYTLSVYAMGATGGENFNIEYFQGTGNCNLPGGTTLTTMWQRFKVTCVATSATMDAFWTTATSGSTIYVDLMQLELGPSAGIPVITTSAPVNGTGLVNAGIPVVIPLAPLTGTVTPTFTAIAAGSNAVVTVPVTGALSTMHGVSCLPSGDIGASFAIASAWVSATGTVSVRVVNYTATSGTPNAVSLSCAVTQ